MTFGNRHRLAPNLGRQVSLLVSVIALALACFPVLAQAECTSSSCVQYTDAVPKPEGQNTSSHNNPKTPAKASKTGDGGGTAPSQGDSESSTGNEESGEGESSSKEGAGGVAGSDGDKPQGNPGGSANPKAKNAVHSGGQKASGVPTSNSSDDSSSSPLVPILIAIAVLAAISVAVVMIRQRRQRRGPTSTASPEAN
jgi:cobalamin biosynthesis Mg chelatase CobN